MKHPVVFNPEARTDLLNLYIYIAEHGGESRALGYIERIEEACRSLQTFPLRGESWDSVRPGMRVLGFERRVSIVFQVNPEAIVIFRILYGGRDLSRILGEK